MLERVQEVGAVLAVYENIFHFFIAGGSLIHPVGDRMAVQRIDTNDF
jgi:hypothetical protein